MRKTIGRGFKFLALVCLLLALAACSNLSDKDNKEKSEIKYGIITGSLSLSGLPGQARSAFSTLPSSGSLTLNVTLLNQDDEEVSAATVTVADDKKSYSLTNFPVPGQYKLSAVLKSGALNLFSTTSELLTVSEEDPVLTKNLILLPAASGYGVISLNITVDSDTKIKSAKIKSPAITATSSGTTFTFSMGDIMSSSVIDGLSSGSYEMQFDFYSKTDYTGELLYSFTESVNVLPNLETSTWVQNGASPWLQTTTDDSGNTSTICHITKELVDNFRLRNIYVDPTATTTSESGTQLNPCRTFSKAIEKLNDADTDYTIFVKGTLTGAQTIPDTLTKDSTDTSKPYHAKSLTLCGANGLDDSGEPQDVLDGNYVSGETTITVLTVNTDAPVHLKNIKITKGYGYDYGDGGGMSISTASEVWIENGALIAANNSYSGPAGIVNDGKCHLNGGKITLNRGYENVDSICGGIQNNGTFIMTDGEISGNTSAMCNGISCSNTSTTEISGGTISNGGTSISVGAGGILKLGGKVNIATADKINLNYYGTNGVAKIVITSSLTGSTPITIVPLSYTEGIQLVDKAEGSDVTLSNEVVKFKVQSETAHPEIPWKISLTGTLVPWIGLKGPSETKSVGDIVFNDGSAIAYNSNLTLDSTQKSSAIAVIFVKRNGNFYGIGLKEAGGNPSCKIAYDGTNGVSTSVGASDTNDGKSNTQKFKDLSDYSQNNYPAIWWAYNYSSKAGNLGTTYNSDWYVPASGELTCIYNQMTTINGAFGKIGNSAVQLTKTREYVSSTEKDASNCICNTMNGSTKQVRKNSNAYFRFVRQF